MDEYPGLYRTADGSSNRFQRYLIASNLAEYAALILLSFSYIFDYFQKYVLLLLISLLAILFISKIFFNFEQKWYRARALAESVKTVTWRFVMRSHPFEDASHIDIPRAEF